VARRTAAVRTARAARSKQRRPRLQHLLRYDLRFAPTVNHTEITVHEENDKDLDKNSISKSEMKRRSLALQAVGEELVGLSLETLRRFELPENLHEALIDAKRINPNKHGGMSRQMQYIGKLMRQIDAAPIIEKLQALKAPSQKDTALHHLAEHWRTRLLADATAVGAFRAEIMDDADEAEVAELVTLLTAARDEYLKRKPPKYYRLAYKALLRAITKKANAV
jgi:ribosome-associated protein